LTAILARLSAVARGFRQDHPSAQSSDRGRDRFSASRDPLTLQLDRARRSAGGRADLRALKVWLSTPDSPRWSRGPQQRLRPHTCGAI